METHERLTHKRELQRHQDEAAFLRELVCELTGLSLDGVGALLRLHRLAAGLTPDADAEADALNFELVDVLEAMGDRWWPTGLIARALLPSGGRGIPSRVRSEHHASVANMLRQAHDQGFVDRRRVTEDGRVLHSKAEDGGAGRTEWRRWPS